MRYVEMNLNKPTATREGVKDHVVLEEVNGGYFVEKRGNIGVKVGRFKERVSQPYPMAEWDNKVLFFQRRGYMIVPGKQSPSARKRVEDFGTRGFKPEEDHAAKTLVNLLMTLARKAVEEAFSGKISIEALTKEQIEAGQSMLDALADGYKDMTMQEFNQKFCNYYSVIPRRMKYLSDFLAHGKDKRGRRLSHEECLNERAELIAAEQDYFKNLLALLEDRANAIDTRLTATQTYGLEIQAVSEAEEKWIRKKLGRNGDKFRRAWKVMNHRTEKQFHSFCEANGLTEKSGIDHLFHGSRGENFWSIIKSGLTINPKDVVITGKAYGQGTYFAPASEKSLGYTDRCGSKWANGTAEVGYLGIYKVATGKRYNGSEGCDSSLNWKKLQQICPGAHCTWAESRYSGFRMDEVIVYQDCQSTIEYLVEVEA